VIKKLILIILLLLTSSISFATPKSILVIGHSLWPHYIDSAFPPNGWVFNNASMNGAGLYTFWHDAGIKWTTVGDRTVLLDTTYANSTMAMAILGINDMIHVNAYDGATTKDKIDALLVQFKRFFTVRLASLGYTNKNTIIFNEWPIHTSNENYAGKSLDTYGGEIGDGSPASVQTCSDETTCTHVSNKNHRYFVTQMKTWAEQNGYTYVDIWSNIESKFDNPDWFTGFYSWDGLHLFTSIVPCTAEPTAGTNLRGGVMCPKAGTVHEVYYWWVLPALQGFIRDKKL
jgi:hypothetical protein